MEAITPVSPTDILVDGFLANTFQDVSDFFTLLLKTPDFLRYYRISYSRGVWYITQNASYVQQSSLTVPTQHPFLALDFSVKETQGTVVPQRRRSPSDDIDIRRHVAEATLQLPIFFVDRNWGVGFWLPDIIQSRDHDLCNRDSEAPLGGMTTTYIRINVSPHPYTSCGGFIYVCRFLSQWPGYENLNWKRQIPARDATYGRNPITLGRFMKYIGTSVDKFFNVSFSLLLVIAVANRGFYTLAMHGGWPWGRPKVANWAAQYCTPSCQDHWRCSYLRR
jgi:hypothetical protein